MKAIQTSLNLNSKRPMKLALNHEGSKFQCELSKARSIAIELNFLGAQPQHFGAPPAKRSPLQLGSYLGSTKAGGSCNCDVLEMIPHCNGTHTETVGHIVDEDVEIGRALLQPVLLAAIVTVAPVSAGQSNDSYRPGFGDADQVVTAENLERTVLKAVDFAREKPHALIVRTIPNSTDKCTRAYARDSPNAAESSPPFFSIEAMKLILDMGVDHLLVDTPSVDRMYDDGLLTNHHLFWNVPERSHDLNMDAWCQKTITEMIFVDDDIPDGLYGLSLQVPAFLCDAAPSRPIIFPLEKC